MQPKKIIYLLLQACFIGQILFLPYCTSDTQVPTQPTTPTPTPQIPKDTIPPALTANISTGTVVNTSDLILTGIATDSSGVSTVTVNDSLATLNAENWTYNLLLTMGTNNITIKAIDSSENANTAVLTLNILYQPLVDTTPRAGATLYDYIYGGGSSERAYSITSASGGGFVMAGLDGWMMAVDDKGKELWTKNHGGARSNSFYKIISTRDGGYILTGLTYSHERPDADMWLVKTDGLGNKVWEKKHGGVSHDRGYDVIETSDGGYAVGGPSTADDPNKSNWDFMIFKVDSNGNKEWSQYYGGKKEEWGTQLLQTSDGGYAMFGKTASKGAGRNDAWLVKTDSLGKEEWNKTYGADLNDRGQSMLLTSNGNFLLLLHTQIVDRSYDVQVIRANSKGDIIWSKNFGTEEYDYASSMVLSPTGQIGVVGTADIVGKSSSEKDVWLFSIDENGKQIVSKKYPSSKVRVIYEMIASPAGFVVAGYAKVPNTDENAWLLFLNPYFNFR